MSSTRPVRSSARQTALRQQEREAELEAERIAKQQQDEKIARQKSERHVNHIHNEHNNRENDDDGNGPQSSASSSRSLSPALSDSSSLSSDGASDSSIPEESQKKAGEDDPYSVSDLHSSWEMAFVYGFLVKFKGLLRQNCPLPEFSIEVRRDRVVATSYIIYFSRHLLSPSEVK